MVPHYVDHWQISDSWCLHMWLQCDQDTCEWCNAIRHRDIPRPDVYHSSFDTLSHFEKNDIEQ